MESRSQAWSHGAARLAAALRRDEPLPSDALREVLAGLRGGSLPGVWHPTGFVVLRLHRDEHGALRLHLWPSGTRERGRPCWPVHDHVWHLRSHVLCGTVWSHGFRVVDDPGGYAVLYAVDYADGRSSRMGRSTRRVSVHPQAPRRVEAGMRYEVDAGAFHASRVEPGVSAATLVATRPTDRPRPWVVGPGDGPDRVPVERPVAEPSLVQQMLGRMQASLPGGE
ncbi:MAG: hypothetical protein AAGF11_41935 [Myxococcota bacterium]